MHIGKDSPTTYLDPGQRQCSFPSRKAPFAGSEERELMTLPKLLPTEQPTRYGAVYTKSFATVSVKCKERKTPPD